ncbi:MAG TPA: hypothetical protein PLZ93_03625 [Nocardioides sp.]|nr:hypothetical protein [Nocardioides sp.]
MIFKYPSGYAGGLVVNGGTVGKTTYKANPGMRMKALRIGAQGMVTVQSGESVDLTQVLGPPADNLAALAAVPIDAPDLSQVVDLTSSYRSGSKTDALGAGRWALHVLDFQYARSQGDPDYIDSLDPEAQKAYNDIVMGEYLKRFSEYFGDTLQGFADDESAASDWKRGMIPWNEGLRARLEEKNRNVAQVMLALFMNRPAAQSTTLRAAYYRAVSDQWAEVYWKAKYEWAETNGVSIISNPLFDEDTPNAAVSASGNFLTMHQWAQVPGTDLIGKIAAADQREAERFLPRPAASVAHQLGRPLVYDELLGGFGWHVSPDDVHQVTARAALRGVNFALYHAPFDTLDSALPPAFQSENPWWPWMDDINTWAGRLMEFGRHKTAAQTALLQPSRSNEAIHDRNVSAHDQHDGAWIQTMNDLEDAQVDFDQLDEGALTDDPVVLAHAEINADGTMTVGQMTYRTVVVPQAPYLSLEAAKTLRTFVQSGGEVVFVGTPGLIQEIEGRNTALTDVLVDILKMKERSKAVVVSAVGEAVASLGGAAVSLSPASSQVRALRFSQGDTDGYLVSNESLDLAPLEVDVTFPTQGVPMVWDLHTGEVTPAPVYRIVPGGTVVPMSLGRLEPVGVTITPGPSPSHATLLSGADGTVVSTSVPPSGVGLSAQVRFTESGTGVLSGVDGTGHRLVPTETKVTVPAPIALGGNWQLRFDSGGQTTYSRPLGSWTAIRPNHSGSATYTDSFVLTADQLNAQDLDWTLDLGDVRTVAAVTINGTLVGRPSWMPYTLDLPKGLLKVGTNLIRVQVANTPQNALTDDNIPSGLLGPVQLVASVTQTVGLEPEPLRFDGPGLPARVDVQYSDLVTQEPGFSVTSGGADASQLTRQVTGLPAGLRLDRAYSTGAGVRPSRAGWRIRGTVSALPGSYPVSIEVTDSITKQTVRTTTTIVVAKERAELSFTGPEEVEVAKQGQLDMALTASVREDDPLSGMSGGDLSKVGLVFSDVSTGTPKLLCRTVFNQQGVASCHYRAAAPATDQSIVLEVTAPGQYYDIDPARGQVEIHVVEGVDPLAVTWSFVKRDPKTNLVLPMDTTYTDAVSDFEESDGVKRKPIVVTATTGKANPEWSLTWEPATLPDGLELKQEISADRKTATWRLQGTPKGPVSSYPYILSVSDGTETKTNPNRFTIRVLPDSATVAYTGETEVASGATMTLAAKVTEVSDGTPGDLSKASVLFSNAGGRTLCEAKVELPAGADTGTASCQYRPNLPQTLTVQMNVRGFYEGQNSQTITVLPYPAQVAVEPAEVYAEAPDDTEAQVPLTATVSAVDPSLAAISTAKVSFAVVDQENGEPLSLTGCEDVTVEATTTIGIGTAGCTFTGEIGHRYNVAVTVGGLFSGETTTVVVVHPNTGLEVSTPADELRFVYSDPVEIGFSATSNRSEPEWSAEVVDSALPLKLNPGDAPGTWTLTGTAAAAPGTYPVKVEVKDGLQRQTATMNVSIDPEAATVAVGPAEVVAGPGETEVEVPLVATVTEADDEAGSLGDISKATVAFEISDGDTEWAVCRGVSVTATETAGVGTATCRFIGQVGVTYHVEAAVGGSYVGDGSGGVTVKAATEAGLVVTPPAGVLSFGYSDPIEIGFTATTGRAGPITVEQTSDLGLTPTHNGDAWTLSGTAGVKPGDYPVSLEVFDGEDTQKLDLMVTVVAEEAVVEYAGPAEITATKPGDTRVEVPLRATVSDGADNSFGDLTHARVSFLDAGTGEPLPGCTDLAVSQVGVGTGTAGCSYSAEVDTSYQLRVEVGGDYYTAPPATGTLVTRATTTTPPTPPTSEVPDTVLRGGPGQWLLASSTTVVFDAQPVQPGQPAATFVCTLDGVATPCSSPYTVTGLGQGSHLLTVAATVAGRTDPSPARVVFTVPAGAKALKKKAGPRWKKVRTPRAYLGQAWTTRAKGAVLTAKIRDAQALALVVGTTPTSGRVKIYLGKKLIGTVNLKGPKATRVVTLPPLSASSGKLRIVTTKAKPVNIQGLGTATTPPGAP